MENTSQALASDLVARVRATLLAVCYTGTIGMIHSQLNPEHPSTHTLVLMTVSLDVMAKDSWDEKDEFKSSQAQSSTLPINTTS